MATLAPPKFSSKLENARVLVLGGTSGIGFSVACAAVESGAIVTVSSSQQAKLDDALSRLRSFYPFQSGKIKGETCDVSSPVTLEANIEKLLASTAADGTIDHIVYTAGNSIKIVPVAELTMKDIDKAGTVRFVAPLMLAKHAPQYMTEGPTSSITLTSGTMCYRPAQGWTLLVGYGMGVEGIMKGLAVDLAPIRVNLVSPGAVHTERFAGMPKEILQRFKDNSLLDVVGKPEDLAEAYLYSMRCNFVTGSVLQVDGGRLLK